MIARVSRRWVITLAVASLALSITCVVPRIYRLACIIQQTPFNRDAPYTHDFLYLITSPATSDWNRFLRVPKKRVDVLVGCFDQPCSDRPPNSGIIWKFMPNTTWTSGRNRLLQHALDLEREHRRRYNYFVFLDGDYEPYLINETKRADVLEYARRCAPTDPIERLNTYTYWECLTLEYAPPHATTNAVPWASESPGGEEVISTTYADAVVATFHREAVAILLPYTTMFDNVTWWASQAALLYRAYCVYGYSLQFQWIGWNTAASKNTHASYPRNADPWSLVAPVARSLVPPWARELVAGGSWGVDLHPRGGPGGGTISTTPIRKADWSSDVPMACRNLGMMNLEHVGFEGTII